MKLAFNSRVYSSFAVWAPSYPIEEMIRRVARITYDGIEIGVPSPHAYLGDLSPGRHQDIRNCECTRSRIVASR